MAALIETEENMSSATDLMKSALIMYEYVKLQIVGQIFTDYSYHVAGRLDEAEECITQDNG